MRSAARRYSAQDLAQDVASLFSYANGAGASASDALGAADAMASRANALQQWVSVTGEDELSVKLQLGVFTDTDGAVAIAERFAVLGAVDEELIEAHGRRATRLTLVHLKPGVARTDVLALARELGLNSLILY